jgi:hypothetical protein
MLSGVGGNFVQDEGAAAFASKGDAPVLSPLLLLPPVGTCTAQTTSLNNDRPLPSSIPEALMAVLTGPGMNAGSQLTVRGSGGSRGIVRINHANGYYRSQLGEAGPHADRRAPKLFLEPGEFTLASPGGKEIGAFEAKFAIHDSFEWTDSSSIIDRANGTTVHWRNASPDHLMVMMGNNVDQESTAVGTVVCVAPASRGEFTIPPQLLANIPLSKDVPGVRYDQLYLSSMSAKPSATIHATGLQNGSVISLYTMVRSVDYR